jgi:hypothetical protein
MPDDPVPFAADPVPVAGPDDIDVGAEPPDDIGTPDEVAFRVAGRVMGAKFAVAAVVGVVAAIAPTRTQAAVGALVAAAILSYAVRDVLARERLRADATGLTAVRGYAGRVHLPWTAVERIGVDASTRFGARTELLEIDAGETIVLFSRFDLGVDPDEAERRLAAVRATASAQGEICGPQHAGPHDDDGDQQQRQPDQHPGDDQGP